MTAHAFRYASPRPSHVVIDGHRYVCTALLRCGCGLVLAHFTDPDRPRLAPYAAHGSGLHDLAAGTLPRCANATQEIAR